MKKPLISKVIIGKDGEKFPGFMGVLKPNQSNFYFRAMGLGGRF